MTHSTSTPPPIVMLVLLGGLLFMLGGVLTTTSATARWSLAGTAIAFAGLGVYTLHVLRVSTRRHDETDDARAELDRITETDAQLRHRMVSTLRDPLTGIVAFADRMLSDPSMREPDRVEMLKEIRRSAREVEGVLADLATEGKGPVDHPTSVDLVVLDHEVRSVIASAPPGGHYAKDLQPARALADSAKVRQIIRTILNAARTAGCDQITVKTGEGSSRATITVSAHGNLLPIEGIAALTDNTEADDVDSPTYIALRDSRTMAADMGGTIGYTEVFGMSHAIVELERAPQETTERLEAVRPDRATRSTVPDLGFNAAADLRPERPTAAIRFN